MQAEADCPEHRGRYRKRSRCQEQFIVAIQIDSLKPYGALLLGIDQHTIRDHACASFSCNPVGDLTIILRLEDG